MSTLLKVSALVVLLAGLAVERGRLVPAPGLALTGGALVAVYLWFLAKARQHVRPRF